MYKIFLLVIKKQQIIRSSKHSRSLCHPLKKSLRHVIILYCVSSLRPILLIFIVYIFTYIIILSCLYAVRQGNVLFKENGKEENALQLSIPKHNLFESLYLFCPNCDIFPCIFKLIDKILHTST